ncbi:MAG: flavin oxidoreductase, partial [Erysipelotrichaceae bacterium]|nr:flavin oxidoreductase [Erysipelotrichaceae bacterium]
SFVCKLTDYNQESGILTADVLDISVDERCLSDGEVDLSKIDPITNNPFTEEYVRIGEVVGNALKK